MTKKEEEPIEVITYVELIKIYKEQDNPQFQKLMLECVNCKHITTAPDFVDAWEKHRNEQFNERAREERERNPPINPSIYPSPKSWEYNPYKYKPLKYEKYEISNEPKKKLKHFHTTDTYKLVPNQSNKSIGKAVWSSGTGEEHTSGGFRCPECGSTAVKLAKGEKEKTLAEAI